MKPARAEALADILAEIAARLEQAEGKGRESAARNLPGDLAKDPRLVDVFVTRWMQGAITDAVREVRRLAGEIRPRGRRRA
jgi:hypothetical protein